MDSLAIFARAGDEAEGPHADKREAARRAPQRRRAWRFMRRATFAWSRAPARCGRLGLENDDGATNGIQFRKLAVEVRVAAFEDRTLLPAADAAARVLVITRVPGVHELHAGDHPAEGDEGLLVVSL